jgi:fatty acid desaturase
MTSTMLPPRQALPDVLPTDRLRADGRPVPDLRARLRRIPNLLNAAMVVGCWLQSFGLIALALWIGQWWAYVLCFLLMGRAHARFNILSHEAAHRLLFSNRKVNNWVGGWLCGYPAFTITDLYRRSHMAHHKEEFGPTEPDMNLYVGYPVSRASLRRKLTRDLVGISGWKNLKGLCRGLRNSVVRPYVLRILLVQALLITAFSLAGFWWAYFLFWFVPWMTLWRVTNRLRAIAEHGGMQRSSDRRETTHTVRQHWIARFLMVPYNTGWHLAHHVDSGIPWVNLPRLHRELVASGYVTPDIEYRSYLQLWRALGSGSGEGRMGEGR